MLMVGFFRASVKLSADRAVKFRMIVFRPFKGEIMMGKIASGTEHGIKSEYSSTLCTSRTDPFQSLSNFSTIF
jgi:DNA-directed RNA polymerase subunit E'/Rpb7